MPRFDTPTVLVTRPKDSSDQFVRALKAVVGQFDAVICPAFEFSRTEAQIPSFDVAIFTSRTGVLFAPRGDGRTAYCVGDATAMAATRSGYDAVSAKGAVDDLLRLILQRQPQGKLLHIRGEISVGDVTEALVKSGLDAAEVVAYRKVAADKTSIREALGGLGGLVQTSVLPLFSAETVSILATSGADFSTVRVVAISPVVAQAAQQLSPASITIAPALNQAEMVAAVARLIA